MVSLINIMNTRAHISVFESAGGTELFRRVVSI